MLKPGISIVIPAYNEEQYLNATLRAVNTARAELEANSGVKSEIIVVNNSSTDKTEKVASDLGAKVVNHPERNISSVRNAGIRAASFELVVTIDADCLLPPDALTKIWGRMLDGNCVGGALGLRLITKKLSKKLLSGIIIGLAGKISGMNGAMFFFRREEALAMGGFDENCLIAEDAAFAIAMRKLAKLQGKKFVRLTSVKVATADRKDISLRTILPLLGVTVRALAGGKQSKDELDYWYKPKR